MLLVPDDAEPMRANKACKALDVNLGFWTMMSREKRDKAEDWLDE